VIRFDHPELLWLLILIPLWIAGWWIALRLRRRASVLFVGDPLLERIAKTLSWPRVRAKAVLWILAWALIVVGAAGLQVGTKTEEVKHEGIDVVLAVDVSNSMLSQDIPPSRLESAKQEILKFIGGLKGDRIGIVAFAGTAIEHCPLTTDYGAAKLLVRILQPDMVPEQGTALSDAIRASAKAFNLPDVKSRVLVIFTDGEDNEEGAIDAAKSAAKDGIKIYAIGMGTPQGGPIPIKDNRGKDAGFKRDQNGAVIVSRLNDLLLERLADAGGGKYVRASRSGQELEAIWSDISAMQKVEFGKKQFTGFEDRFQFLIFPALLLLIGEFFLAERRGKLWIQRYIRGLFSKGTQQT
jgi:Ca-activated chloride channel homolog